MQICTVLHYEEAQKWAEEHLDADDYISIFGEPVEDDSLCALNLTLSASVVSKFRIKPADVFFEDGYVVTGEKTDAGKKRVIPFPPMIPEIKDFFESWCSTRQCPEYVNNLIEYYLRNEEFIKE